MCWPPAHSLCTVPLAPRSPPSCSFSSFYRGTGSLETELCQVPWVQDLGSQGIVTNGTCQICCPLPAPQEKNWRRADRATPTSSGVMQAEHLGRLQENPTSPKEATKNKRIWCLLCWNFILVGPNHFLIPRFFCLGWDILFYAIVCWEYVTCFLFYRRSQ